MDKHIFSYNSFRNKTSVVELNEEDIAQLVKENRKQ